MEGKMKLWYRQPATCPEESLPIGNGSLGGMVMGTVGTELIGLNEETLWSGFYRDKNRAEAYEGLLAVRQMVFERKFTEAEQKAAETMLGEYNECYLPLGNLKIRIHEEKAAPENYERFLNLAEAVAGVSYDLDGIHYEREYWASYPHKAIFVKLTASSPMEAVKVSFETELKADICARGGELLIRGQCPEHVDPNYISGEWEHVIQGSRGQRFTASVRILQCDGTVKDMAEESGQSLWLFGMTGAVLMISAVRRPIAFELPYEALLARHRQDYQSIYNKVELYLGEQKDMPTDMRLEELREGKKDPGLYALFFQYGRYLLISSSREGSLPANLQGIWSWELRAPWSSNWTTNINTQMNYWPVFTCNLDECMPPYVEFMKRLCEEGKKTAAVNYHCRGFVHHHNADYWCNTSPVGLPYGRKEPHKGAVVWSLWPFGAAWLCGWLYVYYEYHPDLAYLRDVAYPIIREAALFLIDWLIEYRGQYVTCPSTSPENSFLTEDGQRACLSMNCAMDLELIREVFGNVKKCCELLQIADPVLEEIDERLSRLAPLKSGSYGQLLEWGEEFGEAEPGHRHLSHLYGLFPSELFAGDERMIESCRVSLQHRLQNGGGYTGWSCAWIINLFAVLKDGENAYGYLQALLKKSVYPNLWDAHPPFQIDGNFGGIAGIANMLVQDRGGELSLLPALPGEWDSGYVKGLRIKGNRTVDIAWKDGKVTESSIRNGCD